jgi:predicted outer membrane repeat protein
MLPSHPAGSRWRVHHLFLVALIACLSCQLPSARAMTIRVGPSAGQAGSACDVATIAEAVAALPADGALHTVEVEVATYLGDRIVLDGPLRHLLVRRAFARASGCSEPAAGISLPGMFGNAQSDGSAVELSGGAQLWLEDMLIAEQNARAAIIRDSDLALVRSRIEFNRTSGSDDSGAGFVIEGGSLVIEDSGLSGNHAASNGGAIFCSRGSDGERTTIVVRGSSFFTGNEAPGSGGAIFLHEACDLVVDDEASFIGNHAELGGGAIAANAQPDTAAARNALLFMTGPLFEDNSAGGDGGAIRLDAAARLRSIPDDATGVYRNNRAGREGGAVSIGGGGPLVILANARFLGNVAGQRGGALAVRDRDMLVDATCQAATLDANRYCTEFRGNGFGGDVPAVGGQGGALYLNGATLRIRRAAFLGDAGFDGGDLRAGGSNVTAMGEGVLARVADGFLIMSNSLVARTAVGTGAGTHLFDFRAGGVGVLSFNTFADNAGGAVIHAGEDSSVTLIGNNVHGNAFGVGGTGFIGGTCNNAQIGPEPAPLDPRFTSTSRGDYRLAEDSPMIDLGLECRTDVLPDGFVLPRTDLDGILRVLAGEPEWTIDAGAFEHHEPAEQIFVDDFEARP